MDTIDSMRAFVAVAAELSFTAGAKRLGISTKSASKQVKQLEERLNAQLFHRTTRSVTLTTTGRAYYERCLPLLDQFDELEGVVQERQSELAGSIRITAPTGFGSRELIKVLKPFQAAHPKVMIDLQLSDSRIALIEEGFDLAIRFGPLEDSSLMARKLIDMRMIVCASPHYLAAYGRPQQPEALATHNCLLLQGADTNHWFFQIDGELIAVKVNGSFRANSPRAIANMTAAGLGIGRCPIYAAQPFLDNQQLEILFAEHETTKSAFYAVYPQNRHLTARIRVLIDHVVDYYSGQDQLQ